MIDHGTVIAEGTSDELKDQVGGERLVVAVDGDGAVNAAARALAGLSEASGEPSVDGLEVSVSLRSRTGVMAEAVRSLDAAGIEADDIGVRRPTLDDVFLGLTGHAAEAREKAVDDDYEDEGVRA